MPFKLPELKMGNKSFAYYCDYLENSLLQYDLDTTIKAMGVKIINAVEVLNWVSKLFERSELGVIKVRYGKIKLGQVLVEDGRKVSYIEVPCRTVGEEAEGYRAVRDLDQNPWQGKLEEVDKLWRDHLIDIYLPNLVSDKQMTLVGYGLNMLDAISILNIAKHKITSLDVDYQDVELGSKPKGKLHKCAIKIDVTAKEKER